MRKRIWNVKGFRRGEFVASTLHPVDEGQPEGKTAEWMVGCGFRAWVDVDEVLVRSRGKEWCVKLDGRCS